MTLFFCVFSGLVILGSVGVIASRNSIHSVLWMIFAFCNASGLFILLGAEFLAMTLVVVYVGAVAVLFLFVVMMLGNHFTSLNNTLLNKRNMAFSTVVLCIFLFDLVLVMLASSSDLPKQSLVTTSSTTNTHAIGAMLYTDFMLPFQISGIILFVAMISCIVLTLETKRIRKKQDPAQQLRRNKESGMRLMDIPSSQGIDGLRYD